MTDGKQQEESEAEEIPTTAESPTADADAVQRAAVNFEAFVLERLAGLNDPNRPVSMRDLGPDLISDDTDPRLLDFLARSLDRHIEKIADDSKDA